LLEKIHLFHQSQSIQDRLKKIITKEFSEEYNDDFLLYTNNSPKITQKQINSFIENLDISDECRESLGRLTPPKAYSYFGTAVKRWLILYTRKNYSNKLNFDDIDLFKEEEANHFYTLEETEYSEEKSNLSIYIDAYVDFVSSNIYKIFPKDNDAQIADAILELFRKRASIDLSNKKAVYLYIREMIDEKTSKITKINTKLQRIFKNNYNFFLDNDYIFFKY